MAFRENIGNWKHGDATTFISKPGGIIIDETTGNLYIHDGVTPGGNRLSTGFPLQSVTVSLTSAQILNAATSPVLVVPAPPVGFVIVGIMSVYEVLAGTTAYNGGNGGLFYGDVTSQAGDLLADGSDSAIFGNTTDAIVFSGGSATTYTTGNIVPRSAANGVGIYYAVPNGFGQPYTLGNGTGIIHYTYYLQAIS